MNKLFEKTSIGSMELENRIVMAPMGSGLPNADGTVSQELIDYCVRRARGGVGLIIVEYCSPNPDQFLIPTELKLTEAKFVEGLSTLARAIKSEGPKVALQLMHPGRGAMSMFTGRQPVAPSPILFDWPFLEQPRELPPEEIELEADLFAEAARRAKEAGFDAVEVHGAHGHLVAQFLSPHTNKRQDEYGRDVYGRARFAIEIVQRTREKVGPDFPILFRISGDEYVEGGLTLAESTIIAGLLEKAGVDAISVSAGVYPFTLEWLIQPSLFPTGCLVPLAERIKKSVSIPVMVAGRINSPKLAQEVLEDGKADLVVMGRALLADPDLPRKAMEGREREIIKCMACNTCVAPERGMGPVRCLMNPELGREGKTEPRADCVRKVLVIGGGPAGLEASRVAAVRGHQVILWDRKDKLGGRWSWMISPFIKHQLTTLKKLGVEVQLGKKVDNEVRKVKPDAVVVTSDNVPVIPQVHGADSRNVLLADEVIDGAAAVGKQAVIIGAGNIGIETAEFLRRRKVKPILIESGPEIGYGMERDSRKVLTDRFKDRGTRILTQSKVSRIAEDRVYFEDSQGQKGSIKAESVILALGSEQNSTLADRLKNEGFQVFSLNYCERPEDVYRSTQEGASIARLI